MMCSLFRLGFRAAKREAQSWQRVERFGSSRGKRIAFQPKKKFLLWAHNTKAWHLWHAWALTLVAAHLYVSWLRSRRVQNVGDWLLRIQTPWLLDISMETNERSQPIRVRAKQFRKSMPRMPSNHGVRNERYCRKRYRFSIEAAVLDKISCRWTTVCTSSGRSRQVIPSRPSKSLLCSQVRLGVTAVRLGVTALRDCADSTFTFAYHDQE